MNILNDMKRIHNKDVNNIAECNLLHGILNSSKWKKIKISIITLF